VHPQSAGIDLACAELVQLGHQQARVDGHAGTDDASRAWVENAGRDQVDRETALLVDHRVTSIGAAVSTDDQVRVPRQQVDDLTFTFVAPMATDDRGNWHALRLARERGPVGVVAGVVGPVVFA